MSIRLGSSFPAHRSTCLQRFEPLMSAPVHPTPPPSTAAGEPTAQQIFTDIYRRAIWGKNDQGTGNSGPGSTLNATLTYRKFLQQFLKDHDIRSVVDAGCGDWEFSQALNWNGI